MLASMLTFLEPDTRIAPPPSPAVDLSNMDDRISRFEPILFKAACACQNVQHL